MHKKKTILSVVLGLICAIALVGFAARSASATEEVPCVPADAWTEVIDHPAVTHVEHHEAGYHTEYHFAKFTHTKTGTKHGNNINYGPYGPWTKWSPETHTSWELTNTPIGSPEYHGDGHNGNSYWYREWQAQWDGQTKEVQNFGGDYDTTVVDHEAWTETIEHPAVVCEEPPTETPTPTVPPVIDEPTPTVPPVTEPPVTDTPTPTPPTEEPPVVNPPKDNPPKEPRTPKPPKTVGPPPQLTQCIGGTWVISQGDKILSSSGTCDQDSVPAPTEAREEGF